MNKKVIAIVGMCGAGKSHIADYLVEHDYAFLRFGQVTLDICKKKGVSGEAAERKIREDLRKEHGMGAFAIFLIPKIEILFNQGKQVVADGLYSWSEYKILKDKYGDNLVVIAVYAPPKLRYQRLSARSDQHGKDENLRYRSFTVEEAKARDFAEIENIEKGGPIAMADYTIINDGDFAKLNNQIKDILNIIEK